MIGENQADENNQKLVSYNEFLRKLAADKKCLLADLNADMQAAVAAAAEAAKKQPKSNMNNITADGVHMAFAGNVMMAKGVLKGFGLNAAELAKAGNAWLDIPNTLNVSSTMGLTQRQAMQLDKLATQRKVSVDSLINEQFAKMMEVLLKGAK
jgi:hypothetical protein